MWCAACRGRHKGRHRTGYTNWEMMHRPRTTTKPCHQDQVDAPSDLASGSLAVPLPWLPAPPQWRPRRAALPPSLRVCASPSSWPVADATWGSMRRHQIAEKAREGCTFDCTVERRNMTMVVNRKTPEQLCIATGEETAASTVNDQQEGHRSCGACPKRGLAVPMSTPQQPLSTPGHRFAA